MIKAILLDDEPLALGLLESHISNTDGIEVVAAFTNPIESQQKIEEKHPVIVLSDIQMPKLTGVQFTKIIGKKTPIVFTTAYDDWAMESYDLDVVDCLLKPINIERFQQEVKKKKAGSSKPVQWKNTQRNIIFLSKASIDP